MLGGRGSRGLLVGRRRLTFATYRFERPRMAKPPVGRECAAHIVPVEDASVRNRTWGERFPDATKLFFDKVAQLVELDLVPRAVEHHGKHVDTFGAALQFHRALHELVDINLAAVVDVDERKDDLGLGRVHVQAREIGPHPSVLEMFRELGEAEGVAPILVGLLEDSFDLLRNPPLILREALHNFIFRASADSAVHEDSCDDVEHTDNAETDVEREQ
mmetsp:Transcript_78186/g.217118  ORF Transcript_78186/g.217118 Transcript_78186/m.217118 type:complete len:217 (+) Transcript_78186:85-735(+)